MISPVWLKYCKNNIRCCSAIAHHVEQHLRREYIEIISIVFRSKMPNERYVRYLTPIRGLPNHWQSILKDKTAFVTVTSMIKRFLHCTLFIIMLRTFSCSWSTATHRVILQRHPSLQLVAPLRNTYTFDSLHIAEQQKFQFSTTLPFIKTKRPLQPLRNRHVYLNQLITNSLLHTAHSQ